MAFWTRLSNRTVAIAALLAATAFQATVNAAYAQGWPDWANRAFGTDTFNGPDRGRNSEPEAFSAPWDDESAFRYPRILDGGPRPVITSAAPPIVTFTYAYEPQSIVIDTSKKALYYVLPGGLAYAYSISVGRDGFTWTGSEKVSRIQNWPDWHPPAEMRQRQPELPEKMTGGIRNPLGAVALYLGNTLYRIHGTNDATTIGQAASSGCFRMTNANALHLASIASAGTVVHVVASLRADVAHAQ